MMLDPDRLIEFLHAADDGILDEQRVRRLAYEACDGDSLLLMTALLRIIDSLAEQLAHFYGNSPDDVLRVEAYLPSEPAAR